MSGSKLKKEHILNNYRKKKLGDKYLITTDHGSFILLDKEEYIRFSQDRLDKKLFDKLEERGMIITRENESEIINDYKEKNSFLSQGTSLHIVIVTLRCNQVCTYCQASRVDENKKGFDMDQETARKTVDFIFQSPSPAITIEFQGGEPLLNYPIVKYIIEYSKRLNKIYKKDLRFNLVSNLTLIDDDMLDFLMKNKVGICTSLDGPKDIHDKNRRYFGGKGSYDDVIKGLKMIRKRKSKDMSYKSIPNGLLTLTRHSLDKPKEIVDEYLKQGFDTVWFRSMSELGCAKGVWDKIGYTAEDFVEFYKKGIDYIVRKKVQIRENLTVIILKKILQKKDPNFLDLRSPCGAAIGQLAYHYDGSIYSCDEGRMVGEIFKLGTVEQSYHDVLTCEETCSLVASSVNDIYLCDNCVFKPYCGLCPVCNYVSQGNLIPKLAQDMRCKIFKEIFLFIFEKYLFDKRYKKVFDYWAKKDLIT